MAPNGFPGGQALFMLIPLIMVGAAVWVLTIAVRDQGGRPKHSLPRLPDPSSHPCITSACPWPRPSGRPRSRPGVPRPRLSGADLG